jgi:DNA-directed RNA polymerase specialized sigma24 family protein
MQATEQETSGCRVTLYDQVMDDSARAVKDAIDAVTAIPDRAERARAASEVLKLISEANATLSTLRRDDIKALREAGMSYRQIGDAIGIHFTRVKQIESGVPTGNSSRSRAERDAE